LLAVASAQALVAALPGAIAVVRPGHPALASALEGVGLRVVVCGDAVEGMGASLACAVRAEADADGWVVALADMPFVRPATIAAVVARLRAGAALCAPTWDGARGHPVGIAARYAPELAALRGDAGARDLLRREADRLDLLPTDDPGVLQDVDTRADLG
jgi:molybdenum cofactor cytidylyltransferase